MLFDEDLTCCIEPTVPVYLRQEENIPLVLTYRVAVIRDEFIAA